MVDTERYVRFERVERVQAHPRGLLADLHGEQLRVDVVAADVLRLKISRGGVFDESPTHAVCVDPLAAEVPVQVEVGSAGASVRTEQLVATLGLDPFTLDVHRTDGSPVIESATDDLGRAWTYATLNDAFVLRRRCAREDAFYGLGEKTGPGDRRGRELTLWNTDVLDPQASGRFSSAFEAGDPRADRTSTSFDPYYVSIPLLHHHRAQDGSMAASFVDNAHRGWYSLAGEGTRGVEYVMHFDGGQYTEYVFAGPTMPAILRAYTALTGRAPLPPLWSLGYHQCRWFGYDQPAVLDLAARLRARGIPCDAVWLDIDHMSGYRVFTWDHEAFPDPTSMMQELAEDGFRTVTIVDPGVKHDPGYPVYDQAVERDVLCRTEGGDHYLGQVWPGNTVFPDFATPQARRWWGELNAAHVASGVAGIWNDMNEPATGVIPAEAMRFDHGRLPHAAGHNQYALLMAMATVQGLREARPDERTFVLSRAGFAGIQRYAANWMGDNFSRWDHLRMSVAMGAGLGISGQPFVGADIGGFAGDCDGELLVRWSQYGALTPFCRNHSMAGTVAQYPWSFGPAVERLVRSALQLRYRLMPYLYAAFVAAGDSGAPVQRPLVFDHQHDPVAGTVDDEYLLGADLLVAPVLEPGLTARQVYLPEGDWYDWRTGEVEPGGRYLVAATPMQDLPLYVRAGAVLPMWPIAPASAGGHQAEEVELHVFPPGPGGGWTGFWQEDDGASRQALTGGFYRSTASTRWVDNAVEVAVTVSGQGYPSFARRRYRLHVHGRQPNTMRLDGVLTSRTDGEYLVQRAVEDFTLRLEW